MNPLVTIAIAAYNVEDFLENGMKCIFSQTYENIEILIVDDGSTDNTSKMCDEIAKNDKRVKVFHKENGGLGSARNVGIENANGEFLYYFDVDDIIEPELISENVKMAQEKKADLIIFGYYARFSNETSEELITLKEREIHSNNDLKKAYCEELLWLKHGNGFAWNKFYRMSFIKKYGFRFGDQRIQQDEPFNMQLYPKLENVYICSKAYYHYVLYVGNNAGTRYLPNKADIITDVYNKFMDFYYDWILADERVLEYIRKRYIGDIFGVVTGNFYHIDCKLSKAERKAAIKEILYGKEMTDVIKYVKISYGNNPINNIQAWAFNHKKINILIFVTKVKKWIKNYIRG